MIQVTQRFLFIIIVSLTTLSSAYSANRCVNLLGDSGYPPQENRNFNLLAHISYESPEWKRISVRDPAQPLLNKDYLYRSYQSVVKVFGPWFSKVGPLKNLPFDEMLRQQHIVLVNEETGGEPYLGATLIAHGRPPAPLTAGQFRSEGHRANMEGHAMSFRIDAKLPGIKSPHLNAIIEWYLRDPSPEKVLEPTEEFPDPISSPKAVVDLGRLPRLNERVKIWNEIFENYITHHYPAARDLSRILDTMDEVMHELRQDALGISKNPKKWPRYLRNLAEYLYLGIHAHPFESGNFSLIMSQVNFILMRNKMKGIGHANLDFLGLALPFEEFLISFHKQLKGANLGDPRIAMLGNRWGQRRSVDLNITAHIEDRGDVRFRDGSIIEDIYLRKAIEGIYVVPPSLPEGIRLQYRGRIQTDGESPWYEAGNFLGTWGQRKALESISFRLVGPGSDKLEVQYQARIGDREWTNVCKNGVPCEGLDPKNPITALRLNIQIIAPSADRNGLSRAQSFQNEKLLGILDFQRRLD